MPVPVSLGLRVSARFLTCRWVLPFDGLFRLVPCFGPCPGRDMTYRVGSAKENLNIRMLEILDSMLADLMCYIAVPLSRIKHCCRFIHLRW